MRGNGPLEGEVKVQGSKNAALPMMAAAVLHEGVTVLHNCPRIAVVFDFGGRDAHDAILNPPARQYAGEV